MDFNHKNTSDQFLIDLHQDWLLHKKYFGLGGNTTKMIKAIEEELKCRKLKPVKYWSDAEHVVT